MSSSTFSKAAFVAVVLSSTTATAFTPPRIGHQYLTIGVTNEPGVMLDDTAPEGVSEHAVVWSQRLRLGLQHAVHTNFYASAEVELGGTYFNPHTANTLGKSESDGAFAWQVAIATRMIQEGIEDGNWVFLQNCHLSISWMPAMDKIIETYCTPGQVRRHLEQAAAGKVAEIVSFVAHRVSFGVCVRHLCVCV